MDINSFGLEFFDFNNASEKEIREIHAILKDPGNNGSVELPWEESMPEGEKDDNPVEKVDSSVSIKSTKCLGSVVGPALQFTAPQTCLSPPVARLPPPEAFVAPPTSVGPYPPYIVSRTIPYLRAYPHMGMPFFACPIPASGGEALPYGQFVPVLPAQEKFVGHLDTESNQKNRLAERQYNRRTKKKSGSSYESVEVMLDGTSTTSSEHPVVPLPPSTFGVAGGGPYPPGLLSYPQSPAMYYVPVFNHPYLPSAPMVLPVNPPAPKTSDCQAAKNVSEGEDCNSSSDYPNSSSPDCIPGITTECEDAKQERCWADLFKKPEVNGYEQSDEFYTSDVHTTLHQ